MHVPGTELRVAINALTIVAALILDCTCRRSFLSVSLGALSVNKDLQADLRCWVGKGTAQRTPLGWRRGVGHLLEHLPEK